MLDSKVVLLQCKCVKPRARGLFIDKVLMDTGQRETCMIDSFVRVHPSKNHLAPKVLMIRAGHLRDGGDAKKIESSSFFIAVPRTHFG